MDQQLIHPPQDTRDSGKINRTHQKCVNRLPLKREKEKDLIH